MKNQNYGSKLSFSIKNDTFDQDETFVSKMMRLKQNNDKNKMKNK